MSCFFWHRWGRWGAPESGIKTTYLYGAVERRNVLVQRRECAKCGEIELRRVGNHE